MSPFPAALHITILGSGTCVPSLARSACAVLVSTGTQRVLLDVGSGTMRRLLESGSAIEHVDHLFLSHFHPDHSGELASFLFASKYPETRRQRPLHLAGGPGMTDFFQRLEALYGHWVRLADSGFRLTEWPAQPSGPMAEGDLDICTAPVAHNPESVAIRLTHRTGGVSVVYTGDTVPCEALVVLARGADMLISEAAVPAGQAGPGHMTPAEAGDMAARAGVGHLVLTHFYPECEQADIAADARRSWQGPLTLASDLLRLTVPWRDPDEHR